MKLEFKGNRDLWAGMMFFIIGSGAIFMAWNYPFGSIRRMGPGYFPVVLSVILIAFGIYIMLRGLRKSEKILGIWSIRALIVLPFSMAMFGTLMDHTGFFPALIALIFVSAASGKDFKLKEASLLALILGVLSVAVFIWGLGLPFPLIGKF